MTWNRFWHETKCQLNFTPGPRPAPVTKSSLTAAGDGGGGRVCGDDGGRRGDGLGHGARLPHAAADALPGG